MAYKSLYVEPPSRGKKGKTIRDLLGGKIHSEELFYLSCHVSFEKTLTPKQQEFFAQRFGPLIRGELEMDQEFSVASILER